MTHKPHQSAEIPSVEQVKQWHQHNLELLEGGATIDQAGHLAITNTQYDQLHESEAVRHRVEPAAETAVEQTAQAAETAFDSERLAEIVRKSSYAMKLRLAGDWTTAFHWPDNKKIGDTNNEEFNMVQTLADHSFSRKPSMGNWKRVEVDRESQTAFNDQGITEAVTLIPAADLTSPDFDLISPKKLLSAAAGYSVIQYETLVESGDKYEYHPAGDNRHGQYLKYRLALPNSEAQDLWQAMQADPELARELGDRMITSPGVYTIDNLGVDQSKQESDWQAGFRPPYGEWRTVNGGVDRMAFRASPDQPLDQAKIVEF